MRQKSALRRQVFAEVVELPDSWTVHIEVAPLVGPERPLGGGAVARR